MKLESWLKNGLEMYKVSLTNELSMEGFKENDEFPFFIPNSFNASIHPALQSLLRTEAILSFLIGVKTALAVLLHRLSEIFFLSCRFL
jgi:hypothetical protein